MIDVMPLAPQYREWANELLRCRWGSTMIVSRGVVHDASNLPGFIARIDGERIGLLTFRIEVQACEIVTLDSLRPNRGIGSALIDAALECARRERCSRVWLITTNDNIEALRFYLKRGFRLIIVHRDALDRSRQLKPGIPTIGLHGIPLRDELELEISIAGEAVTS
jgi:ribosomal protein S18 acetylase RimI-like enzyme